MYDEARRCGFEPPNTLDGRIERNISSRFEERRDITWIPESELKRYIEIYNKEFGNYKHIFEREQSGTYKSVFAKKNSVN